MILDILWILATLVLGALRLAGFKSLLFQGIAHIVVGMMFGGAIAGYRVLWIPAIGLTILELIASLVLKL